MKLLPATLDSMDDDSLKTLARSMANTALTEMLPGFVSELRDCEDLDIKLKGLRFLVELGGAKAPQQKEESDNLPMVNFNINTSGSRVSVSATSASGETQVLEITQNELSDAMAGMAYINEDVVLDVD